MDEDFASLRSHGRECAKIRIAFGQAWLIAIAQGPFSQLIINLKPYPDEKSDPAEVLETGDLALENAARFQRSLFGSLGRR